MKKNDLRIKGWNRRWMMGIVVLMISIFAVSCMSKRSGKEVSELDKLRLEIRTTVTDTARKDALFAAIDGMADAVEQLDKTVDYQRKLLYSQIREYSTTRQAIDHILAKHIEERQMIVDQFLKYHYEFKGLSTADEWKKLEKLEKKFLTEAAGKMQDRSGMKGDA